MKTKVIREDKRRIWLIQTTTALFYEGSPTILYNYLLLLNSLKRGIAHFSNIQPAKPQRTTTTTTAMYNRCVRAKENMHPLLCLEWTKQVTITSQQNMCSVFPSVANRGNSYAKATEQNLNRKWRFHSGSCVTRSTNRQNEPFYQPYHTDRGYMNCISVNMGVYYEQ